MKRRKYNKFYRVGNRKKHQRMYLMVDCEEFLIEFDVEYEFDQETRKFNKEVQCVSWCIAEEIALQNAGYEGYPNFIGGGKFFIRGEFDEEHIRKTVLGLCEVALLERCWQFTDIVEEIREIKNEEVKT